MSNTLNVNESFIDSLCDTLMKSEMLSLNDRINSNTIELKNYNKHDGGNGTRVTGKAVLLNKVPNLTVVDVDINKSLSDIDKERIRRELIRKLDENDIIVKTASGGLHIYCNTEFFTPTSNRMIKCYSCSDFDVDLMSTIDSDKRSLIVLPDSKVRKDHRSPINTYTFVRGNYDSVITRTVEQVMRDLDITITLPQRQEIMDIIDTYQEQTMSDDLTELIIDGLSDIEVHNDAGNMSLAKEVTLFTLFQAVNALPGCWINYAYEYIYDNCKLTDNARSNFEQQRQRYSFMKTSPYVLVKILKIYKEDYYNEYVKPLLHVEATIYDIDLNEEFDLNTMINKAEKHEYKMFNEVLSDLSKVIRRIDADTIMYLKKVYDIHAERYTITYVNQTMMKEMLKAIRLWKVDNKQITAWNVLEQNSGRLSVRGVKFNTNDKKNYYCHFHGYKYQILENINYSIIETFINFIHEVICNNNEEAYNYVLQWIAYILQNPGVKSGTALVLKGLQGIGKNTFTDVISELTAGYSCKNVTDINELTGTFNSVVENKMFIVLNEMKNNGDDRLVNFNSLKSVITDDTIRINEKNQPRRTAENVSNFVFLTNNSYPVKIEGGDRRYIVLSVSAKYKEQFTFWNDMYKSFTHEFYDNLLTYFIKYDLSAFNVRQIPITEAKQDLIEASRTPVEQWICDHYTSLVAGMECSTALSCKPKDMKDKTFQLQIKDKCDHKQLRRNGMRKWYYILKEEYRSIYKQNVLEDDEYIIEDDDIPVRENVKHSENKEKGLYELPLTVEKW